MNKIPTAIGPYSAFSKKGNILITSGQLPIDPETNEMVESDITLQTRQSLENVKAILEMNGCTLADVMKSTVYLQSMDDFGKMNEVYATYFNEPFPARTAFQAAKLPKNALVEIEVLAFCKE